MKSNPKKHNGFTLIEVIISMAVIAIVSVGAYNSYLLLIRQTRDGQVKQTAALEGKQVIEEIKDTTFEKNENNYSIELNGETLSEEKSDDGSIEFSKSGDLEKKITFKRTQTEGGSDIGTNNNQSSDFEEAGFYKLYVTRDQSASENYITDNIDTINSGVKLTNKSDKLIVFVYLDEASVENKYDIKICDYKAKSFFEKTNKDISKGIVINFSKYKNSDGSAPSSVEINIYNRTANAHDIYIQKSAELNVEAKIYIGEMNLYNNRAEEGTEVGDLYDITVTVKKDGDTLFTGYSKQNITGWK